MPNDDTELSMLVRIFILDSIDVAAAAKVIILNYSWIYGHTFAAAVKNEDSY